MRYFEDFDCFSVPYCDGGSWTGRKPDMYYDGRNTLEKTMRAIISHHPNIQRILLTGCSAGGLGVIHACHWIQSMFQNVTFKCMHDGSLFFGNMSDMIRFHGGVEEDTINLLTAIPGMFFTITDLWDWDFITSAACKKTQARCTANELVIRNQRRTLIERMSSNHRVWMTQKSYHCQLGTALPPILANEIRAFISA